MHRPSKQLLASLVLACAGIVNSAAADTNTTSMATNSASSMPVYGDHGGLGLGVIIGEPTGFTMKYWLSRPTAIDLTAAWSFDEPGYFEVNSDFLYHKFDLFKIDNGELPIYFGVGGRVAIPEHGDTLAGVRIPVGIAYEFHGIPLEVFGELAPIVDFAPSTQARLNGGIGIRFYFR
jgi:hypothetical protein